MASSLAFVAVLSLVARPFASAQTCEPCQDVHMFLARGNNEPYPGRQGNLVSAVCSGLKEGTCGYEDLHYSALFTDLSCQTTYDGCLAGFTQMTSYAERCPDSKLILAGYSQGAQIVLDILGGGGGESFNECIQPSTPALDRNTSPGNRLAAVIAFGDTRHTANQPYDYGNGSIYDGVFPRTDPAVLAAAATYTDITRDWCLSPDPICAFSNKAGPQYVSTHLGYYDSPALAEAAAWIKSVASLTNTDASFTTSIPISLSGTAQNYATIPSGFIPPGTVTTSAVLTASVSCAGDTTTSAASSTSSAAPSSTSIASTTVASSTLAISTSTTVATTVSTTSVSSVPPPPPPSSSVGASSKMASSVTSAPGSTVEPSFSNSSSTPTASSVPIVETTPISSGAVAPGTTTYPSPSLTPTTVTSATGITGSMSSAIESIESAMTSAVASETSASAASTSANGEGAPITSSVSGAVGGTGTFTAPITTFTGAASERASGGWAFAVPVALLAAVIV